MAGRQAFTVRGSALEKVVDRVSCRVQDEMARMAPLFSLPARHGKTSKVGPRESDRNPVDGKKGKQDVSFQD